MSVESSSRDADAGRKLDTPTGRTPPTEEMTIYTESQKHRSNTEQEAISSALYLVHCGPTIIRLCSPDHGRRANSWQSFDCAVCMYEVHMETSPGIWLDQQTTKSSRRDLRCMTTDAKQMILSLMRDVAPFLTVARYHDIPPKQIMYSHDYSEPALIGLKSGLPVKLRGLTHSSRFNGCRGILDKRVLETTQWNVRLDPDALIQLQEKPGLCITVKAENINALIVDVQPSNKDTMRWLWESPACMDTDKFLMKMQRYVSNYPPAGQTEPWTYERKIPFLEKIVKKITDWEDHH